jgi:hypothetical protein
MADLSIGCALCCTAIRERGAMVGVLTVAEGWCRLFAQRVVIGGSV